jgi:hypothetical protein
MQIKPSLIALVTLAMVILPTGPASAAVFASASAAEDRASEGPQAPSLVIEFRGAAAPGSKKNPSSAPAAAVTVADGQLTAVAVGLRPLGIDGSTSPAQAPSFALALPSGLDFVRVASDLDHGVTGQWQCTQAMRRLGCNLVNGRLGGTIPTGRVAQAVIVLMNGGDPRGSVVIDASASGGMSGQAPVRITAQSSLPIVSVPSVSPTVLLRDRGAPVPAGDRNGASLSLAVLGPAPATMPSLLIAPLAPKDSTEIVTTAPDFTCSSRACTSRNALPIGSVTRVDASFVAGGKGKQVAWTVGARYVAGAQDSTTGLAAMAPVRQPRNTLDGPNFDVEIHSPDGQSLPQGGRLPMSVSVLNQSSDRHAPRLAITLPPGVNATENDKAWNCAVAQSRMNCSHSSLRSGVRSSLTITLQASRTAADGIRVLDARELSSGTRVKHQLQLLDVGDPVAGIAVLTKETSGWQEWNDGSLRDMQVGLPTPLRFQFSNRGGDHLYAGSKVRVSMDSGAEADITRASSGLGTCSTSRGDLTCTLVASRDIAPGQIIGTVDVVVVPRAVASRLDVGDIRAKVLGSAGTDSRRALDFRAVQPLVPIHVTTKDIGPFTQSGVGEVSVRVRNDGKLALKGLEVIGSLPSGLSLAAPVNMGGWTCAPIAGDVRCLYPRTVQAGAKAPLFTVGLRVGRGTTPGDRTLAWISTSGGNEYAFGRTESRLFVRPVVRIAPTALPAIVTPRADAAPTTHVVLRSGIENDGDQAWTHSWRQMCLTKRERTLPVCQGASRTPVPPTTSGSHTTSVQIPTSPDTRQTYVYEVRVEDGSASLRRTVDVTSVPMGAAPAVSDLPTVAVGTATTGQSRATRTVMPTASTVTSAGPSLDIAGGPLVSASTGASVTLAVTAEGNGPFTYAWDQVLGAGVTLSGDDSPTATFTAPSSTANLAFAVTVTDVNGLSAIAQVSVVVGAGLPSGFCNVYNDALKAQGTMNSVLGGGVNAVFSSISVVGTACQSGSSFTFSGSSLSLGGFTVTGANGTVTPGGIAVTAGTLSPPASWGAGAVPLDDAGLALLWTTSGGANSVSAVGSFTLPNLMFLPLPSSWAAATQVLMSATTAGATQMSVSAQAAGPNSALATFAGNVASSGTFNLTVTADNLVYVGNAGIDASGTIQQQTSGGSVTGSVTGSLGGTSTLVSGITIPSLSITWAPGGDPVVAAAGSVSFAVGTQALVVDAAMDYSGPSDWSVTVDGAGTAVWQPLSGLQIPASGVSGSFAYSASGYSWDVSATAPTPWSPTGALTISSIAVSISNDCPSNVSSVVTCPNADVYLALSAEAEVDSAPVADFTADVVAVIGMGGGGGFAMSGDLSGSLEITDGLTLTSASITATYQVTQDDTTPNVSGTTENGYTVAAIGDMTINPVGNLAQIQATVTSAGWTVAAFVDGIYFGNPTAYGQMTSSVVAYSSFATTLTPPADYGLPPTIALAAGETYVSGTYQAPTWFLDSIDASSLDMTGTIEIDPSDGSYSAVLDAAINESVSTGSSNSSIDITELQFSLSSNDGNILVAAQGDSVLDLGPNYGASPPQLDLGMSYDLDTNTVSGYFNIDDSQGWENAFNDTGLTLFDLTVQLSLNLDTMTPAVGLSATADLPSNVSGPFQVPNEAPITAFIDLSADTPCIGVSIGTQGEDEPTVLIVGGGVVTASFVDFYVAPDGCTIGTTTYDPGFALDFDGTILNVGVDITSALTFSPTTFVADVTVDSFQVGPLLMDTTTVDIDFVDGGDDSITFSGGFDLFGTDVTASGGLQFAGSTTSGELDVQTNGFTVEGFSLTDVDVSLSVTDAAGDVTIDFAGSGDISVLQDTLDVQEFDFTVSDNVLSSITADVTDTLTMDNGIAVAGAFAVNYASSPESFAIAANASVSADSFTLASATLAINADCASLTGSLDVPDVVTASMSGYVIYGSSSCSITDPGTGASETLAGSEGDFFVQASVSGISVADFSGSGCVMLTNVSAQSQAGPCTSSPTAPASVISIQAPAQTLVTVPNVVGMTAAAAQQALSAAGLVGSVTEVFGLPPNVQVQIPPAGMSTAPGTTVNLIVGSTLMPFGSSALQPRSSSTTDVSGSIQVSLVLGTQDVNNSIMIDGNFQSNGYFTFTGSDTLDVGGFDLDATVSASNSASGASVSATGGFDLLGNDVTFSGSFTNVGGSPSTSMTAAVNPLTLGGFDLGSGSIALNQTSSSFGMSFAMNLSAGSASMDATVTFDYTDGTTLFYVYTGLSFSIPGAVSVSIAGSFSNCSSPSCTGPGSFSLYVSGSFSYGNWGYSTPAFNVGTSGGFNFSTSASQSGQSTSATNVAGVNWWTGNDSWNTSLSVSQSGISASAGGQATIYSQESPIPYWCGPWYAVWERTCYANQPVFNWGTTGAQASANPWRFCFQAFGSPLICL